ncbi:MAG TPA: patatin-like phospholipase family protein [Candidatus Limnocylindria bacterium]|nr:patatin-like phospholipase family protein [Candidatus Limnocylindria bacterium]
MRIDPVTATPPRTALVLAGGGITGFLFEIGALAALEETLPAGSFSDRFDLFVGTSAGSVAAALLANDVRPSEIFQAVGENLDSPFNFRAEDVFGTAGSTLRLLAQFARPLGGAITRALRRGPRGSLATMLADFQEHHPPGFYSTEPLERTLCERFGALGYPHRFDELPRRLYVTGADIDTAERLVFGAGDLEGVHICRAVAASCAIPIFFQPIRIGERDVVDGGVAGATAIDVAAECGARVVVHVNPLIPMRNDRASLCLPLDGKQCARLAEKGVGWIADQSLRMLLAAKLADTLVALDLRYPDLVIHAVEPRADELPMFEHNPMSFAARRELLDYGYACGRRAVTTSLLEQLERGPGAAVTLPEVGSGAPPPSAPPLRRTWPRDRARGT